jgi:hypothetical protein
VLEGSGRAELTAELRRNGHSGCSDMAGMARHVNRSDVVARERERAGDRPRSKESALVGHVDYLELAERVGQGIVVSRAPPERGPKSGRDR